MKANVPKEKPKKTLFSLLSSPRGKKVLKFNLIFMYFKCLSRDSHMYLYIVPK